MCCKTTRKDSLMTMNHETVLQNKAKQMIFQNRRIFLKEEHIFVRRERFINAKRISRFQLTKMSLLLMMQVDLSIWQYNALQLINTFSQSVFEYIHAGPNLRTDMFLAEALLPE